MQQLLFNLHTHSHFCDGSSAPEEYVLSAIKKGFHTLGFSSHAPVPFDNKFAIKDEAALHQYVTEIRRLKEKYKHELRIFLSLEIDFIPGITRDFEDFKNLAGLDYTIGGVHLVKNPSKEGLWFIDGSRQSIYDQGLSRLFDKDIKLAVTTYWEQVREMIDTQSPDIVAHLDKIKMHNKDRYFTEDEPWYQQQLDKTLELIAEKNIIVEVNTRGLYKKRSDDFFPGKAALQKIYDLGIPITLNSDSHKPEELKEFFAEARTALQNIGFKYLMLFIDRAWEQTRV